MTALKVKGFTLVELLVVVGILGILAAALLMTLDPFSQVQKGNDAKRKSDLSQIQKALETYYQDKGRYPAHTTGAVAYRINADVSGTLTRIDWGESWQPYMNILPEEKTSSRRYVYYAEADGQSYYLYASLERGDKDPQACNGGSACNSLISNGIPVNSCVDTCNYGVTSSNTIP